MGTLRAVVIMVLIYVSLVFPMTIPQDSSDIHVKKNGLPHRVFKREGPCPNGEHFGNKHCCQNCNEGFHLESECTVPHGESVCKECSEGVDFMDKKSGYAKCQKCRDCASDLGQEVLHQCTTVQDRVCKCKEGFFCSDSLSSPNENCNRCRSCTECDSENDEQCIAAKKTVCGSQRNHITLWAILLVFIIIGFIIAVLFLCRKAKKKEYSPESPRHSEYSPKSPRHSSPICPPHLENTELDNHLFDIAGIMTRESVQQVVTKKLTAVELEEIKENNRNNAREEKHELLKKWYNANGLHRACKTLIENSTNGEAEKIIALLEVQNTAS